MAKRTTLRQIEKRLKAKFINMKENEVVLREYDLEGGRLTKAGYISLKQQSDYVPLSEDITVRIPHGGDITSFRDHLEYMATKELLRLKTDMRDVYLLALFLFILGLIFLALPAFVEVLRTPVITDIFAIISWVFVWAAVERAFFEVARLKDRRRNILHLVAAKIRVYKKEADIISETTHGEEAMQIN